MPTDQNVIRDFDDSYEEAYVAWNAFFPEAERDLRFFLGDQWSQREKSKLFNEGRNAFVFNRVRRTINMVTGYQRKNRLSSVVAPVENSDQKSADQRSQLLLHAMNYGDGYQMISDCFGGALKTGWNLMSVWVDYRDDPVNGDVKFCREPYNSFILDPYLTKLDLTDCNYALRRKYLSVEQVSSLLPDHEKEIHKIHKFGWERDDKFTWLPYQRLSTGQEMMAYNESYRQKWKTVPVLVDMETGEMTEFDMDRETIGAFLRQYPQLKVIKRSKRYIECQTIVNDNHIKTEIDKDGLDEYPFVPFICTFEPESDQWDLKVQSLTRCMIDPQREANIRRSQMVDIIDSQINSGWIATENSVVNPQSLFQSSQGKVIWKKDGAPPDSLQQIQAGQIPPSMFQLQELFDRDMVEIAGINDAAFGQTENANDSGVMMMLRQGAALVNLQELFDNLRNSQKSLSMKVLKLIQKWNPAKVQRILNEPPSEKFYDEDATKYDIVVQEGILTDTQRQMYFRQLVDLKQLGAPVTGEMLAKAAPIQGKSEYIEELAAMEKAQAEQAQQAQKVQEQLLDSQRQMSQAKAISDLALSKERFTRSVANLGLEDERASKAVENRSDSALQRVRAMKELESMDDDRLMKYFQLVQMMEDMNSVKEDETKADDVMISAQASEVSKPESMDPQMQQQAAMQQQPMEGSNGI